MEVEESVGRAVATAGKAVVFAGGTVVIAILGLAVAGIPFMTAGGIAISVIVLIMVIASITAAPRAPRSSAGPWINRLGLHRPNQPDRVAGTRWVRWGDHVARHAKAYAVAVPVLLLAPPRPSCPCTSAAPTTARCPRHAPSAGPTTWWPTASAPGPTVPLVIAVDISRDSGVVDSLHEAVGADAGIDAVAAPQVDAAAGVATMVAFPTTGPQDERHLDHHRTSAFAGAPGRARAQPGAGPRRRSDGHLRRRRRPGPSSACPSSSPSSC